MGTLSVVATPIGNLDDITFRAVKILFAADAILCEDTRHTGLLLNTLISRFGEQFNLKNDWKPTLISYYDRIEEKKLPEVIALLTEDKHLALVSDAGTPLISDPGFRLVRECMKRGIRVESIPGASAVLAALTVSGLPADKFLFIGYPPERQAGRRKLFRAVSDIDQALRMTYVLYCAPHKLVQTLGDMMASLGDLHISIARELTKVHEEVWTGSISEALKQYQTPKGEFVVLFRLV